jgi:hypothetical protein
MTDQRSHTPGPWRPFIGNGNTIAVMRGKRSTKEVIKWTGFDGSDFPQHAVANAVLIAAAPMMLAALESAEIQLSIWSNASGEGVDCLAEIRAAIAAAKGASEHKP